MKNSFTAIAMIAAGLVIIGSICRYFIRNTKKYLRNDSFQL